jgi:guanylate kinase
MKSSHAANKATAPYIQRRGMMFVLSSPSGAGKTTITRRMLEVDSEITLSISVTTRARRSNEIDGRDYHFITPAQFNEMVKRDEFLEHATVFDHHYGTPKHYVNDCLTQGKDVVFDIDWQGTRQLSRVSRGDLVSVFILPPSMAELERRLRTRAQDNDEVVTRRMAKAASEISHWQEYDYVLVNDNLEATINNVRGILEAERMRRIRQPNLASFIETLK